MSILVSKEKSIPSLNHNYLRNPKLSLFQPAEPTPARKAVGKCLRAPPDGSSAEIDLAELAGQYTKCAGLFTKLNDLLKNSGHNPLELPTEKNTQKKSAPLHASGNNDEKNAL